MICLSKSQIEELTEHAKKEAPNEACGILAGHDSSRKVKKIYRMANADNSPRSFFMDPKEQLKVMKEIRTQGLEMAGIYHSHPQTGAYPSEHDIKLAFYPAVSYVIVSLKDENDPVIRSFKIAEGEITEEEVKTE
jgi:[CysO sulfur-carrier protein]-S-L-cysteine hydrolase